MIKMKSIKFQVIIFSVLGISLCLASCFDASEASQLPEFMCNVAYVDCGLWIRRTSKI